ncbi:unnamed protein product, partial [Mesorhabditis spiculigera]
MGSQLLIVFASSALVALVFAGIKTDILIRKGSCSPGHQVVAGDDKYRVALMEIDLAKNDQYALCDGSMYGDSTPCMINSTGQERIWAASRLYLKIYTQTPQLPDAFRIRCIRIDDQYDGDVRRYEGEFFIGQNITDACHLHYDKWTGDKVERGLNSPCTSCCDWQHCDGNSYILNEDYKYKL